LGTDASAAKRALLLRQMRHGMAPVATAPLLAPEPGTRVPLTIGQEQMWLDCQIALDEPVYNEAVTVRRTGPCDVAALRRAFNLAMSRHEAWRTNFVTDNGQVHQVVRTHADHPMPLVDLSDLPAEEREAQAMKLATAAARAPFDLEHGPLVRPLVVRLSPDDHRLYLALHHLVFDGVALRLFLSEMLDWYRAFAAGQAVEPPTLPVPYSHYACWERKNLTADALEPRLAFWRDRLLGATPVELPVDLPIPADRTRRGAMQRIFVDRVTVDRLREIGRENSATFFLVMLTAYAVLLHRYSGQEDLVIAALVDGRRHRQLEKLVGFMLNPLPVRIDLSGDPSFDELLGRVREAFLVGLAQEVPFGELLRRLRPDGDASRSPIFQAMFSLGSALPALGDGWDLSELDVEVSAVKSDVHLLLEERGEGLVGRLAYSTDLFVEGTGRRMVEHLGVMLEGIAADPGCRVSALPFLTEAERAVLVDLWNRTEAPYPATSCVHELFEEQARLQPDAVAVVQGDRRLTYRALNESAGRLAAHLQEHRIEPDTRVGVCVERSLEMVVAVLGILKAGAAYVPLDPAYPPARLAFMVDDADIGVLVTQTHLLSRLPPTKSVAICVDRLGSASALGGTGTTGSALVGPDNLAYVIYTSGSTGLPKGVMIEHRGVVNHIAALLRDYGIGPDDTVIQLASLSFHPSVRDVFGPLCAGARLVLLDEAATTDPVGIVEVMARERVTCALSFVPSLLRAVLDGPLVSGLPEARLRLILTCGEALHDRDARRAMERFGCVVANQFGPTESIMACAKHTVGDGDLRGAMVPAGRPEANARLYVVDRFGGLAPIGAPGELLVGGLGVARGYLNGPELTAERFGVDPFLNAAGARVHHTRDLVRYREDGCLHFLGRIDDQVKIRGYRVELGEVELALARCDGVNQAVAAVQNLSNGDCRLVAVVTADPGRQAIDMHAIRSSLERHLPSYMVPAAIGVVEQLPLTPNGKVDRDALTSMNVNWSSGDAGYEPPMPGLEAVVAEIWAEALGRSRIGRHDNFFDLGGHSLMATRILVEVERRTGRRLRLAAFFGDGVTVGGLARVIEDAAAGAPGDGDERLLVSIRPGALPALFCVYPDDASLIAARHLLPGLEPDRAVFGLRPSLEGRPDEIGEGGAEPRLFGPPSSVQELACPLLEQMLRVQPEGPYLIAGYSFAALVAYELAARLSGLGKQVAFLGLVDMTTPRLYSRDVKPRVRHLVRSRNRKITAMRLLLVGRRRAHGALARVGLSAPPSPNPNWSAYLERARLLGGRYRTDGLDCPLVVFFTEASRARYGTASLGWDKVHPGPIEAVGVSGDHVTLWKEPNVGELAAVLAARVTRAAAGVGVLAGADVSGAMDVEP
jgi:amino acid adenylation domain-containing protein